MAAVRHLQGNAQHGKVYRLLSIFLTGQLRDYLAFHAENPDVVAACSLSHDECVAKMRLMSLAALGTESAAGQVTYQQVQETLQVPAEEVEGWIVRAIGANVLEAKMDQVRRLVVITRCLHRVFAMQQWVDLAAKLSHWRDAVSAVLPQAVPA